MDKDKIIELLRQDMRGEQQAIIQYLFHAYAMEEGPIPGDIEAIAREEMRHLDWLADEIVELGGDPAMERDPVDFGMASHNAQMAKNVGLEDTAIRQYRQHIQEIDDPKIQRLLSRILHDENVHKAKFEDLAEAVRAEESDAMVDEQVVGEPKQAPERLAEIMNQGIRHEYTVILQYLYHSFVAQDGEVAEQLENAAINEMQHMGWLSEELMENGGVPDMNPAKLFLSRDMEKNLEADIAVEQEVARDYTSQIPELVKADLQELVSRIRDHEIYHSAVFEDLLEEVREKAVSADEQAEPAEVEPPCVEEPKNEPASPPVLGSLK